MIRLRNRTSSNAIHDNHYLFGTSAIPLEAGRGYYQMHDVVMHSASFSPVQGLSLGGGAQVASVISSLVTGKREPLVYARIQASGPIAEDAIHLGGFAMAAKTSISSPMSDGEAWPAFLGLGGAQATFGTDPAHVTLSIGGATDGHGLRDGVLIGLAALWHVSGSVALISENWQIPIGKEPYRIYSVGARYIYRTMAFDGAFAFNKDLVTLTPFGAPVLTISLRL